MGILREVAAIALGENPIKGWFEITWSFWGSWATIIKLGRGQETIYLWLSFYESVLGIFFLSNV